jgi:hypothetical protein
LLAFAGVWTTWRGTRRTKANPVEAEHQLFESCGGGSGQTVPHQCRTGPVWP